MPKANPFGKVSKKLATLQSKVEKLNGDIKSLGAFVAVESKKASAPKALAVAKKPAAKKAAPKAKKAAAPKAKKVVAAPKAKVVVDPKVKK